MTEAQEKRLQAILGQRRRRLVLAYRDNAGALWAVSRPVGQRNARYDQRHRIGVRGSTEVWIETTDGAPD